MKDNLNVILLAIENNKVFGASLHGNADWYGVLGDVATIIVIHEKIKVLEFSQDLADELAAAIPVSGKGSATVGKDSKVIMLAIRGEEVGGATLKGAEDWQDILLECTNAITETEETQEAIFTETEADALSESIPAIK